MAQSLRCGRHNLTLSAVWNVIPLGQQCKCECKYALLQEKPLWIVRRSFIVKLTYVHSPVGVI